MSTQNYENHAKIDFLYHRVLFTVFLFTFIGACVNLYHSIGDHQRLYSASLIVVIVVTLIGTALYARVYALKAQDRAIRAEENFRHYVLTGKTLDARLTMRQIIALRFASDGEFVELVRKAAESGMEPRAIKQTIKSWKADNDRL